MEFDNVKENIQPLAVGRNVSLLQASLRNESHQELMAQRSQLEDAIKNYNGDDPLEPWYAYICWIEQSYPSGGSESGLQKVIYKCLTTFDREEYKQDRRLIKLFIKFMETQKNPTERYQQMFNCGFGTMVADFYIAWAYTYDLCDNTRKADEIFRRGLACRAEPLEELKEAHQHYGFSMAQRMLYSDGEEAKNVNLELNERRLALQSLRGHKRKGTVGSVRTGAAIKNHMPGTVKHDIPSTSRVRNAGRVVEVFNDENMEANAIVVPSDTVELSVAAEPAPSLSAIVDAVREQENIKEPGPWNRALEKGKHKKLFPKNAHNDFGFTIHTDENNPKPVAEVPPIIKNYESRFDKAFNYPDNFVSKNRKETVWLTPVTIEEQPDPDTLTRYNKCMLYPRPNIEFQHEEWMAYRFFQRRGINNDFVLRQNKFWSIGDVNANVRRFPNFATKSKPQLLDELDSYFKPSYPTPSVLHVDFHKLYNDDVQCEYQVEELLAKKWLEVRNKTIHSIVDMEETFCAPNENLPRRKSFFPTMPLGRKSIAPSSSKRSDRKSIMPTEIIEDDETESNISENRILPTISNPANVQKTTEHSPTPNKKPTPTIAQILEAPNDPSPPAKKVTICEEPALTMFLPPAPPVSKIPIFEDSPSDAAPSAAAETQPSAFYDADETCSTQMFNIFIKSQSVSTPKAPQKQSVGRQFGTLLKETLPIAPTTEPMEEVAVPELISPGLRKQLSTILETSEHATTQGTHSSGGTSATTKSTITSPSTIQHITKIEDSKMTAVTPAEPRLQRQMAFNFSVFEDPINELTENVENKAEAAPQTNAGNFTRLEQREDTVTVIPVRFQEDKTETITKTILRFQEDKTETLSKILMPNPNAVHTTTASNSIISEAELGAQNNISKLGFMPPQLPSIEDNESFDFFTKTPEKATKQQIAGEKINSGFCSPLFPSNSKRHCNQATPDLFSKSIKSSKNSFAYFEDEIAALNSNSKANIKMPQMLADDSCMLGFSFSRSASTAKPAGNIVEHKNKETTLDKLTDSFMNNLSFIPETQETKPEKSNKIGAFEIFHDETLPETQEVVKTSTNTAARKKEKEIEIYLDCTLPETQEVVTPAPRAKVPHAPIRLSSAKDKENALTQSMVKTLAPFTSKNDKEDSFMKDLSTFKQAEANQKETSANPSHLTASFMKDLGEISKRPEKAPSVAMPIGMNISLMKSANTTLKFRDDSSSLKCTSSSSLSSNKMETSSLNMKHNDYFELNAATEMFSTNISMIKNSTLLPTLERSPIQQQQQQQQQHQQQQQENDINESSIEIIEKSSNKSINTQKSSNLSETIKGKKTCNQSLSLTRQLNSVPVPDVSDCGSKDGDMSIYYKSTPKTPRQTVHVWDESDAKTPEKQHFVHQTINPDQTLQVFSKNFADPNVNPFNVDLINAFLESIDFINYILDLPTCEMVGHVKQLSAKKEIRIKNEQYEVLKIIGEGAYGAVYSAKHTTTGKLHALKQERPPNYWEYYICLEVKSRLTSDEMIPAYMNIDKALIGNNASIFVSDYSPYGSLITVCNKVKKHTMKNVDEYIVMHLTCQLLSLIDHLHAMNIIHADVKADNFLLTKPLSYPSDENCLQLIDFGVSIDMKRFPDNQTFNYVHKQNAFKCVEMRIGKPWNYQLDLYGLSGVIHVLLFGKYMDIENRVCSGLWMPKQRFPRYFNKFVWENIFRTLLNIRDAKSMPNLQDLRSMLKSELADNEKYVTDMIKEFNRALSNQ